VTLLAALAGGQGKRSRTHLRAVHVHHGLHPNADKWSKHCAKVAAELRVPLTILRTKVARPRGASLEAAARNARYDALASVLTAGEILLTAHHEDDQLETVLLQLMRGAGVAGLAAMPEVTAFARGRLARPLLSRSRAELEKWATSHALIWIDDDTNADEGLDRNYLRRRVLPLVRDRWPAAASAVSRSARHAAEARRLLDAVALADVERAADGAALSVQRLRVLDTDRRRNALRFWIARAGFPLPDTRRLDEIAGPLLDARPDANPEVRWSGAGAAVVMVRRHADRVSIRAEESRPVGAEVSKSPRSASAGATTPPIDAITWHWRASARCELGALRGALSIEPDPHGPIDLDALPEVLTVRQRKGGERLRPGRGGPTKTLKALFQETRVPLPWREHVPLVFHGERLLAAGDRWLDASVQVSSGSKQHGRLHWHLPTDGVIC
jgi:tRNA(Ile)-lysidine synthase